MQLRGGPLLNGDVLLLHVRLRIDVVAEVLAAREQLRLLRLCHRVRRRISHAALASEDE